MIYLTYIVIAMITAVIVAHYIPTIDTEKFFDCTILAIISIMWPLVLFVTLIYSILKLFKK